MFCALLLGILIGHSFNFCGDGKIIVRDDDNYFVLALVLSSPKNFERRMMIRETWASLRPKQINNSDYGNNVIFIPKMMKLNNFLELDTVDNQKNKHKKYLEWIPQYENAPNIKEQDIKLKVLFAIGTMELDKSLAQQVKAESKIYNDLILIDNLLDSYQNLTLKLIESFKTMLISIPNFKYVLKADDDTYVKLDLLTFDLLKYDQKLKSNPDNYASGLYWGYFNGRANIKKSGQWSEENYNSCDRYSPYALGGGYVISKNIVNFIATNGDELSMYKSEDISVGAWLSHFRKIYRRHDIRFDTAYMPRKCQKYHLALHKRTMKDMKEIHDGNLCYSEVSYNEAIRPKEYWYDWSLSPLKCCDNKHSG